MNSSEQVRVFELTSSCSREDLEGNMMEISAVTQWMCTVHGKAG